MRSGTELSAFIFKIPSYLLFFLPLEGGGKVYLANRKVSLGNLVGVTFINLFSFLPPLALVALALAQRVAAVA